LEDFITKKHLDNMAKVILATGLIVAYGYIMEIFSAWYSGNKYEGYMMFVTRMKGPYAWSYWALIFCNVLAPNFLWSSRIRSSIPGLFTLAMIVNVGMWLERFVIVVLSLHRDFLPSSWNMYYPTRIDAMMYIGSIGLFFSLLFLFIRFLPMISIFEMRTIVPHSHGSEFSEADEAAPQEA